MRSEFTGRHMAILMVTGFGIVIAVNFYMASLAIGGFGGVVVENSYVASQKYNGWLAEAREARRLGYSATMAKDARGRVVIDTAGLPPDANLSAAMRRPLGKPGTIVLAFKDLGSGRYVSAQGLPPGRWIGRLAVDTTNGRWVTESELR